MGEKSRIAKLIEINEDEIFRDWIREQLTAATMRRDLISEKELQEQSRLFLKALAGALRHGDVNSTNDSAWTRVTELIDQVSHTRAAQGFSPSETATFIFSLKPPLMRKLKTELGREPDQLFEEMEAANLLLDKLGLYSTEVFQRSQQDVIGRQQEEMLELSTPVVKLWDGVLALPLVGTLDSRRTQIAMEALLEEIVRTGADVAIIDITGVPTVDTLVAQHLLKTVAATRLMGAECILSGIRPQIAQTIVHLNIDLGKVPTKATLADAFALALKHRNLTISAERR